MEIFLFYFILPHIIFAITETKENSRYIISAMFILLEIQNKQKNYDTYYLSERILDMQLRLLQKTYRFFPFKTTTRYK